MSREASTSLQEWQQQVLDAILEATEDPDVEIIINMPPTYGGPPNV